MRITLDAFNLAAALEIPFMLEHPEYFGRYRTGETPASIWRLPEVFDLAIKADATRWALHQHSYGTPYAKPTGILASFKLDDDFGVVGWPVMRDDGAYAGPLPRVKAASVKMGPEHTMKTTLPAASLSQDRAKDLSVLQHHSFAGPFAPGGGVLWVSGRRR